MKKILITGANSYIGTSFETYIQKHFADAYAIDTVDMIDGSWRNRSFSGYDSVFHVAGIAHSDHGKISAEKEELYYAVNTDLTVEVAKKAKDDGVKQFIFMSSSIVYGESAPIGKEKIITKDTPPCPANCYGNSKLRAEHGICELENESFRVVVLRPPMIYGKGCKGNYKLLRTIATKFPCFPYVDNQRSMLYIENLCEFVRLMVINEERGTFFPQNNTYSNTSDMVRLIAKTHDHRITVFKGSAWLLKWMGRYFKYVNKAFGNLIYDRSLSGYRDNYCLYSLEESIRRTEEP